MRASGPYSVKPRQLRALVLLLALLPLIPTIFVVRFLIDDVANQRLEARERARPVYQKFLEGASATLAAAFARQLQLPAAPAGADDPWQLLDASLAVGLAPDSAPADAVLLVDAEGRLTPPPPPSAPRLAPAAALAAAVLERGVRFAAPLPPAAAARWRFFSETPEPLMALRLPSPPRVAPAGNGLLLLHTRARLRARIEDFYRHAIDPQTALRLLDENGEATLLSAVSPNDGAAGGTAVGEPLAEVLLPSPLPAWRVQLYSVDPALIDGIAHEQIVFYWWSVGGMVAVTAGIAWAAGWALTRRIALHELSNDALAIVSHEMKTPLASTRLFIDTLLERRYRGGPEQADDYLRLIADENARLERLVDSFQTLSRLEQRRGRPRVTLAPVTAGEIAREAAGRLRARLEAPGCAFTLEGGDEPTPLRADREGLVNALVNLLDNALKYTAEDGKRITLRCRAADGEAVYEVSDNGLGIEAGEQRRIFERFYQADQRLSRAHEGCGLGLSIVRSLVRAHRGTVSVQSTPGEGSTFTVRLPTEGKEEGGK